MSPRTYIAGPMRGYPEHNIPAFRAAAIRFRALGHTVVSPVEVGDAWAGGDQSAHAAEEYVRRDLLAMLEPRCTAIALLPGWERSTGARLEATVALVLGFDFYDVNGMRMAKPARIVHTGGYEQPPGATDSLDGAVEDVLAWQRATFSHRTPHSITKHLLKEAAELHADPTDDEEWADVAMLAFALIEDGAPNAPRNLIAALRAKLEKNKARTWGAPDAGGVVEHVKESAA